MNYFARSADHHAVTGLSLAKLTVAVGIALAPTGHAATITVHADCSVQNAIEAANTDAVVNLCAAGNGADTIELPAATLVVFSSVVADLNVLGSSALPAIRSSITIQGNGATLQPSVGAPMMRLFTVLQNGDLTLSNLRVSGGEALSGGGILCSQGSLTLLNSEISSNSAMIQGGGIAVDRCPLVVDEGSMIDTNYSGSVGGGLYAVSTSVHLVNSSLTNNEARAQSGGGAAIRASTLTMNSMTLSGNSAQVGGGLFLQEGVSADVENSSFSHNAAYESGGAVGVLSGVAHFEQVQVANNVSGQDGAGFAIREAEVVINQSQLTSNTVSAGQGGAIDLEAGQVALEAVTVSNNSAIFGGALNSQGGSLSVSASTFSSNTGEFGGALNINSTSLSITNSTLSANSAGNVGGGIALFNASVPATLSNNRLTGNIADDYGGGVFVSASTEVASNRDTLSDNLAQQGGGWFIQSNASVTLSESSIHANTAYSTGGGLLSDASSLRISDSTVANNSATTVAGLFFRAGSSVSLRNSTISTNVASFAIGGISQSNSDLTLAHSTVVSNQAPAYAAGVFQGGALSNLTLINSIVAQNDGGDCNQQADTSYPGNWIGDASCTGVANGDPMLGPLASNGGITLTHALLSGSGAIGIADTDLCAFLVANKDQRGFDRGVGCDAGAYEYGATDVNFYVIPLPQGGAVIVPL
ncbi:hypothetical protein GCM10008090_22720 [Arenicella chitinivorans]|uniref:CSLREA domain-containing protein n=1 Tax=Arenicella chitinivorans TaxID=1329800 RepID=A0A918RVI5_9GAMM|nr:choice-of-anchor Q domain-containing protein [Arenicella chitinivorans]GHA12288.1 hypothetical protein GCM10008090_22720 [Arenicella chitinivorans]